MDTEMGAGPELDALVAEKVMGWSRGALIKAAHPINPDIQLWYQGGNNGGSRTFCPSSDIQAAMEAIEKSDCSYRFEMFFQCFYEVCLRKSGGPRIYRTSNISLAHAICLALLGRVGLEIYQPTPQRTAVSQ